jgi:hypothetical protein
MMSPEVVNSGFDMGAEVAIAVPAPSGVVETAFESSPGAGGAVVSTGEGGEVDGADIENLLRRG